jgi:hypothetical protein
MVTQVEGSPCLPLKVFLAVDSGLLVRRMIGGDARKRALRLWQMVNLHRQGLA